MVSTRTIAHVRASNRRIGAILPLKRYNSAGVSPTKRVRAKDRVGPRGTRTRCLVRARPMILTLFVSFFTMIGFYLLLSVVPLYAEAAGGGSSGAGLATAVFMLSTVLAQVWMPRILARFGYREVLAVGLLLLGLPAFLYVPVGEVLAFLAALGISSQDRREGRRDVGLLSGLRRGSLLRIFLLFACCTAASGVVVTFLPLSAPGPGPFSAATALLFLGIASTFFRWWAGRFGDRRDPHLLLAPGLVCAALGMVTLSFEGLVLLGGALLFGVGFGALQNTSLLLIMQRVPKAQFGLGSTLWNLAFDAGTGAGAFVFGFVVEAVGFSWAFFLCAGLLVAALVLIPRS